MALDKNIKKHQKVRGIEKEYMNTISCLAILVVFMGLIVAVLLIAIFSNSSKEYNRYACQATGYEADCKTPLNK